MQATVQITPEGMVIANLDTDDYAADDDDRALMNLKLDDMLDQVRPRRHSPPGSRSALGKKPRTANDP